MKTHGYDCHHAIHQAPTIRIKKLLSCQIAPLLACELAIASRTKQQGFHFLFCGTISPCNGLLLSAQIVRLQAGKLIRTSITEPASTLSQTTARTYHPADFLESVTCKKDNCHIYIAATINASCKTRNKGHHRTMGLLLRSSDACKTAATWKTDHTSQQASRSVHHLRSTIEIIQGISHSQRHKHTWEETVQTKVAHVTMGMQ